MTFPEATTPAIARGNTLIVGLGGEFGDDRVGWCVIQRLHELIEGRPLAGIHLEIASTPADLLKVAAEPEHLVIIDACQGLGVCGTIARLDWPGCQLTHTRHSVGHNLTLDQALSLAASLGQLPAACELWCIEGERFEFGQPPLPEVELASSQVAAQIFAGLIQKSPF